MEILKISLEGQLLIKYCVIKHLILLKFQKYDGYQRTLTSKVYKFFNKKTSGETVKNDIISNKELAEQLHKPIIKKIEKRKVH